MVSLCDRRLMLHPLDHAEQPLDRLQVFVGPLKAVDRTLKAKVIRHQRTRRRKVASGQRLRILRNHAFCIGCVHALTLARNERPGNAQDTSSLSRLARPASWQTLPANGQRTPPPIPG